MKRVMIVTNSLTGGGAERSMNLVSNELARRGWPIALVPINSSMPDLVTPTCEIFCLNRHWRGNAINTLSAFVKFNQLVCSWKPDVIILNCDLPELFGALVIGTPSLVVIEHSNIAWANRTKLGKGVRMILSIRHAIWVAVSSHLKIWPNGRFPKSILQNPVTPTVDSLTVRTKKAQLQRLVFIGRLTPEKRPNYLLEIAERSGLVVEIMGEGFMKESLHEQAVTKSLKVTFSGQIRDPWSLVRPGDLLIVPSASEGDGLVVIEGMKRRVPILLCDIPDFRRFGLPERNYCQSIDDFVAHIVQYRDNIDSLVVPKEITTAILNSRSLEVVGNSWENFLDRFD